LDTEPYTVIIQEYEKGFCKAEGTIDNAHFGYTGYGYSNTENMTGVIMEWAVYGGTNASFNFEWRYANMEINRPASVLINGITEVTNVNFESTLEWTNWTILNTDVNLNAGNNIIQLKATSTSGLANIDYLKISGPGANAGTCSTDTMPIPSLP
jgi:hypothetical protein